MGFYDEMADVASELLTEFKQGETFLKRPVAPTQGATSYDRPTPNAPTSIPLNGTFTNVEGDKATSSYADGETILGSDLVLTFPALDATPTMADMFVVNNITRAPKKIITIPPSGVPVVHKVILES